MSAYWARVWLVTEAYGCRNCSHLHLLGPHMSECAQTLARRRGTVQDSHSKNQGAYHEESLGKIGRWRALAVMATLILDVPHSPAVVAPATVTPHHPHEGSDLGSVWGRLAQRYDELRISWIARGACGESQPHSAFSTARE